MSAPLVSILIPCYNAAPWLAATLRSALGQTWQNLEVIFVNDGSTDESLAIARACDDTRLKILTQPNAGQSAAFNRAARAAQGDFFEYLDADDLMHPEKIARQIAALREAPPTTIASGAWARFRTSPDEAFFQPEEVWRDLSGVDWLVASWSGGGMMHGAAWLLPRAVAERAGPWGEDLTLVNDFDFFARALLASDGVKFCPNAKTYYRSGLRQSVSAAKTPRAWASAYTAFTRGIDALLAREDTPRTQRAAAITFQSFAYGAYPLAPALVAQAERRVRALGGCELPLRSGRLFNFLVAVGGWKLARRAQFALHRWRAHRP